MNPYTSFQAHPVYPPLDGNLHVYLELGNELWNTAGAFFNDYYNLKQLTIAAVTSNDADFQAINYDHLSTAKDAHGNFVNITTMAGPDGAFADRPDQQYLPRGVRRLGGAPDQRPTPVSGRSSSFNTRTSTTPPPPR